MGKRVPSDIPEFIFMVNYYPAVVRHVEYASDRVLYDVIILSWKSAVLPKLRRQVQKGEVDQVKEGGNK